MLFVTFSSYAENIGFSMMSIELGLGWIMITIATLLIRAFFLILKEIDPLISSSLDHDYNGDTFKYILIKLEFNVEGKMQVYLRSKDGEYSGKFSTFIPLNKGYNSIYLKFPNAMTL
ncbi:hypothetical protein [Paenibacillus peoriae]|uniref:hypothetical protein n=1 Tax=Paenibacillus peoriae TaxID=59893 RepID=UPI00215B02E1|nr:hypothetical protein [Paenibacillus peoriae]